MSSGETISVTLSAETVRAVRESVEAGEYASASEVMQEAVLLWERGRHERAEHLESIRARIRRSLEDPRPDLTGEQVDDYLNALFARAEKEAGRA